MEGAGKKGTVKQVDDGVAAETLLSDYGELAAQGHTRPTSPAAHAAMLQFVAGAEYRNPQLFIYPVLTMPVCMHVCACACARM